MFWVKGLFLRVRNRWKDIKYIFMNRMIPCIFNRVTHIDNKYSFNQGAKYIASQNAGYIDSQLKTWGVEHTRQGIQCCGSKRWIDLLLFLALYPSTNLNRIQYEYETNIISMLQQRKIYLKKMLLHRALKRYCLQHWVRIGFIAVA